MRIADTWSYMGDAVATSAPEIADAMSKASASLKSVGVEFERASAYAAIMIAKTQQAGQVIGTQLNSIASRYAKVTSTGYRKITSDDEGEALSFNDVSKSLKMAGIEMYNVATGEFKALSDVLDELAPKWNSLDEATQKYIATSIGGTRGMNYFLTLMENYDEALELEQEALDNRGIANEKYLIWLEGVEAAQNNLKNSSEQLYSVLSGEALTGLYNTLAGIIDVFAGATDAVDGLNLKLPLMAAGAMLVVGAITKMVVAIKAVIAASKSGALLTALTAPANFMGILAGITVVLTAFGLLIGSIETAEDRLEEMNSQLNEKQNKASNIEAISKELDELADKSKSVGLTADEVERFRNLAKQLADESPAIRAKYGLQAEGLMDIAEAAGVASEELTKTRAEMDALARLALPDAISVYDKKIKKLYGQKAPVTTYDEHFKNIYGVSSEVDYSLVGNYINEQILTSDINTPLKVLEAHLQELDTIIESDWFQNLENSDLKESIENAYTFVDDLITRKNGEIQDLRIDLAPIINGSLADIDLESIFSNNFDLKEVASNYLLDYDWGDESGAQISKVVEQFMLLFGGAFKDLDPELLFGGENPIADYFIRAFANGENQKLIGNIAESVAHIFNEGMSTTDLMKAMEKGRRNAKDVSPIWGAQMAAAQQIVDGRNAAIKYINANSPKEVKIEKRFDRESNLTYSKTSPI